MTYALQFEYGCPRAEADSPEEALAKIKAELREAVEALTIDDLWREAS